ncbi:MAG TPA: hypothetical protein PKV96_01335 [Candidatus Saccharimonas sp.]|nr:hypothetical protein [Candidatus Saccharimonas sp.]
MDNIKVLSSRPTAPDPFSRMGVGESRIVICLSDAGFTPTVDLVQRLAARGSLVVVTLGTVDVPGESLFGLSDINGIMLELTLEIGADSANELDAVLNRLSRVLEDGITVPEVLIEVDYVRSRWGESELRG